MSSIAIEGIGKDFLGVRALAEVTLDIAQGEFVTVLGPSGSGKSTLLSIVAGLEAPTRGRILLGGSDITDWPANRRGMGLVFQSYALFPTMTVFDNVAFPLRVRRMGRAQVKEKVGRALDLVRMGSYANRRIGQISGGQQQRVALARALVFDPAVLLLDEPMGALDRKLRQDVQVELRELHRRLGMTTLMVTHDQEEALSLSDRIALMREGRIEQVGTPTELYTRPRTAFVADFFGAGNILEGRIDRGSSADALIVDGLRVPCIGDRPSGHSATAMLRPELVSVQPGDGGICGVLRETIYLGTSVRHHVTLDGGSEFIATVAGHNAVAAPGDRVSLSWRPEDVWLIPPLTR